MKVLILYFSWSDRGWSDRRTCGSILDIWSCHTGNESEEVSTTISSGIYRGR